MEKKKDLHKKSGGYLEVIASRHDNYGTLLNRMKEKFPEVSCRKCSIFRSNGARVVDADVMTKGSKKEWTLGAYLNHLHVSPDNMRLGIGYNSSSDSEELPESILNEEEVSGATYIPFL